MAGTPTKRRDAKALDQGQRAGDVEAIEEAAANAGHQAVERNAHGHDVRPGQRDQRQILRPQKNPASTVDARAPSSALLESAAPLGKPLVPEV
jgi:hypothetical protein